MIRMVAHQSDGFRQLHFRATEMRTPVPDVRVLDDGNWTAGIELTSLILHVPLLQSEGHELRVTPDPDGVRARILSSRESSARAAHPVSGSSGWW